MRARAGVRSGAYDVFGGGGVLTTSLWEVWSADHAFTTSPVAVTHTPQPAIAALQLFLSGQLDFAAVDDALPPAVLQSQVAGAGGQSVVQLPIAGNTVVIAYNLPGANATLVLNGTVLADIWQGKIAMWDDAALIELNPAMNLPHANITTVFGTNSSFDETSAFARSLGSFSYDFAAAFTDMESLPPVLEGRSVGFVSPRQRVDHVAITPYALTYARVGLLANTSLPAAMMWNRGGRLLTATTAGVQSAMLDAQSQIEAGNLTADLFNGPGEDSWPLSYLSFATFFVDRTGGGSCVPVQQFAEFLQWAFSNTQASNDATAAGYAPLLPSYTRRVLGSLNRFTCNGLAVLDTVALFGLAGTPYEFYSRWAVVVEEIDVEAVLTDSVALSGLGHGNADFALLRGDPSETTTAMADGEGRVVLPVAAFPYVPAYTLPDSPLLTFDLPAIADIYLGRIQKWNHENLSRLNPLVVLPDRFVRVVYPASASASGVETSALHQLLAKAVPLFNASVADASSMYSFVVALNTSVSTSDVPNTLNGLNDGFAVWPAAALSPQIQAGNVLREKPDGEQVLVELDFNALLTTLLDFAPQLVGAPGPNSTGGLYTLALGPDATGWPLVGMGAMAFHTHPTNFCASARALNDFLWWTQTDTNAFDDALENGAIVAGVLPQVRRAILRALAEARCQGQPTSSLYRCINDGVLCSNTGTCTTAGCSCRNGYSGTYCEEPPSADSTDTSRVLGIVLGTVAVCVMLLMLAVVVLGASVYKARQRRLAADHGQGLVMAALNEEPTPDVELDTIKIDGIAQVETHRWNG
ncbi:phosphate-binding periplasmic protein, putative [Acanthamoeba castellanii str. Neff]|uniref:Phosphate-binding periplasmic protein, putative n=1 Tax=Acanthamoeba castellanii (strain ATCC 30010 / Neff) TaxID=1257118 RepID=L8GR71_ACACF|nr:phosphate-binding periplasmic protein, putative [Acanthamoeba castellanii str. Neff]ELR15442.1 phosphate-binding periplasmic protein, putative [Acanthamoeba castellanii str. Neff]